MDRTHLGRFATLARRGLAAAALAALLAGAGAAALPAAAAAQADGDGDGLYDDDEWGVYGTDPYAWDSDGDGAGDGEEVYYGTDPLAYDGGEVEAGFEVAPEGDSAGQCAGNLQFGQTGNFQTGGEYAEGGEFAVEPGLETACETTVQQSAAASG